MTFAMTPEDVTRLFTRADGSYAFARWARPIAPVAFGVADETLSVLKGALEALATLAHHPLAETDPELGANLMVFFIRNWRELVETPNLDRMIPDLAALVQRLEAAGANQYRIFRFDAAGGICACFVFIRMDDELSAVPAEVLLLGQSAQSMLLWSETAFLARSPLAVLPQTGATILRPDIAGVIRAAYDPSMPVAARDPSHALRLSARLSIMG